MRWHSFVRVYGREHRRKGSSFHIQNLLTPPFRHAGGSGWRCASCALHLREIVTVLERCDQGADLKSVLRAKIHAAILDKNLGKNIRVDEIIASSSAACPKSSWLVFDLRRFHEARPVSGLHQPQSSVRSCRLGLQTRVFSDSSAGFKKHLTFAVCIPFFRRELNATTTRNSQAPSPARASGRARGKN